MTRDKNMIKEKRIRNGHGAFSLHGELNIYCAGELKKRLCKYTDTKYKAITIDTSEVSELDTACLQLLIGLKKLYGKTSREMKIVGHSPAVIDIMELLGLCQFFGDPMVLRD